VNREDWLIALAEKLRPDFAAVGRVLPTNFKVSTGFPSQGALSRRRQRIGECWHAEATRDGIHQIFVSPVIDDGLRVGDVLIHELCHAALPADVKHGKAFAKLAYDMGLQGKPTSTVASPSLTARLNALIAELGSYPHAAIERLGQISKQSTRMLKVSCLFCGYTCRLTAKWLERSGAPICPTDRCPMVSSAPVVARGARRSRAEP
jgi:hypothetical protein